MCGCIQQGYDKTGMSSCRNVQSGKRQSPTKKGEKIFNTESVLHQTAQKYMPKLLTMTPLYIFRRLNVRH